MNKAEGKGIFLTVDDILQVILVGEWDVYQKLPD